MVQVTPRVQVTIFYGILWIIITLIKWMHITCLYSSLFRGCIILWSFCFFFLFPFSTEKSHGVVFVMTQIGRDNKIKSANLWIHLDLAQVHSLNFFLFVYLLFLNLNNNLTLPKLLMSLKLSLIWNNVLRFPHMCTNLWNQNKCKLSDFLLSCARYSLWPRVHFLLKYWRLKI